MPLPTSDNFSGESLDVKWTTTLDAGPVGTIGLNGSGQLVFTCPAAANVGYLRHTGTYDGMRIFQPALDTGSAAGNCDIRVKLNTDFTADGAAGVEQTQGITLFNALSEFINVYVSRESGIIRARMNTYTGSSNNSVTGTISDWVVPYWLRVTRTWNSANNFTYTVYTSPDGTAWTQAGSPSAKTAAGLQPGVFVGNQGGASAVAWNPEIDYFEEADDPVEADPSGPDGPTVGASNMLYHWGF